VLRSRRAQPAREATEDASEYTRRVMALFVSASIALAATSILAFRYSVAEPGPLVRYFAILFVAEWIGEHFFLPKNALGIEVALVCLLITGLFVLAGYLRHRLLE
jgi:hypothetical protein